MPVLSHRRINDGMTMDDSCQQASGAPADTSSKHREYDALSSSYWNTELLLCTSPLWSTSFQCEPKPCKRDKDNRSHQLAKTSCYRVRKQTHNLKLPQKRRIFTFQMTAFNPELHSLKSKIRCHWSIKLFSIATWPQCGNRATLPPSGSNLAITLLRNTLFFSNWIYLKWTFWFWQTSFLLRLVHNQQHHTTPKP